ncbi:hypothetical protein QJS66_21605 [Kocuria rhizophila]|nr:hypothetical protein QJS66_21605 [Kocuria rhizophila]
MSHLKWLVVRDLNMIESASMVEGRSEIASGELKTEDIDTEVFCRPRPRTWRSPAPWPDQRLVQWRRQAVAPPGDAERAGVLSARQPDPWSASRTPQTQDRRCWTSRGTPLDGERARSIRCPCWPSTAASSRPGSRRVSR